MKPRKGEKPPLSSNSTSHTWRLVRSHDGHSFEWALSSAARDDCAIRLTRSPPCGAIRWLVEVKSVNLLGSCKAQKWVMRSPEIPVQTFDNVVVTVIRF